MHIAQEVATNASKRLTLEEQTLLRDINDAKVNNINQVLKRSIFNLDAYLTAELIALESTLQLAPTDAHTKAYVAQLKAQLRVNHDQGVRSLTTAAQLRASTLNTKLAAITLTAEEKAADKIRPRATKKAHNEGYGVLNTLEQPTKERRYVRGYKNEIASLTIGGLRSILDIKKALDAQYPDAESLEDIKSYIEKLKAAAEEAGDNIQETVQKLVEEYQAIGHVPFKEKDKLYEEYHAVLDKLYKELNVNVAKRRLNNFRQNLKQVAERGENALDNERARLFRQYEALKQEIQTYENNLGFLNASSKKGNSLIDEMNRKVQKLKDDMNFLREKIKAIDAENKE